MSQARIWCESGTFTPHAEVLCFVCLPTSKTRGGNVLTSVPIPAARPASVVAQCDDCGKTIGVGRSDVAELVVLRSALRARGIHASLEQTGGMCVALSFRTEYEGARYWIVTTQCETEPADGRYFVGLYKGPDWSVEGDIRAVDDLSLGSVVRMHENLDETFGW